MKHAGASMLEYGSGGSPPMVGVLPRIVSESERVSSEESQPMQGAPLTERQRQVLEAIRDSMRTSGFAPTHLEIARAIGLPDGSASAVEGHLKALARKGWIAVSGVARGIRLLREGVPILDAQHLPAATAGAPGALEACADVARLGDLESVLAEFESRPDYFVRVEGDALDGAGFAGGDIVAVRRQREAREGDVVLVRTGAGVTLKRFARIDAETVPLQPLGTNPEHEAAEVGATTHDAQIVGVVVGAIVVARRAVE